jgi:PAS domain S-box-containing protein
MQQVFEPAIALMNRLRYPQKFALISLLFALPLGLVMFLLLAEMNKSVAFAHKETLGTAYLRPLRELQEHTLYARALAGRLSLGDEAARRPLLEARAAMADAMLEVQATERRLGPTLNTVARYGVLARAWDEVKASGGETSDASYALLLDHLNDLAAQVGDTSNLILDPDLDTYYLMDAVLLKLPEGARLIAQTLHDGRRIAADQHISPDERMQLIMLRGLLRDNLKKTENGLSVAFRNNPQENLLPILEGPLEAYLSSGEQLLATLDSEFIATKTIPPRGFFEAGEQALQANFALWDDTVVELDGLLTTRIQGFNQNKYGVVLICLLMLALVTYLLIAFYKAVMRTIATLRAASKQMSSGIAPAGAVRLDTRDEMGDVVASFNTIALRLRAEWEQVNILAHAVRSTSECVSITDMQNNVLFVNQAFLRTYGYQEDELLGRPIDIIRSPNNSPELTRRILPTTLQGGWHGEVLNRRKDGREFPVALSTSVIRDEHEQPIALIGVASDISERRRAEEELRRAKEAAESANRSKSAFLANMSHELRTPLNAIIGYSEMLQEEALDLGQDAFVPDLQKIYAAGKHLLMLINDILDLSKIEAGKMELFLETFDIGTLVSEVVTTIQPLIARQQNQLVVELAPALGLMRADVTKVRQALFNLLSNASKFTQNGTVTLRVARHDELIRFAVEDSGIGMSDDQLSRLFQAFSQADASTTRKYGGTGLGLAITRRFCQMMGGDIEVQSTPGVGSAFTITLPAEVREPRPEHSDNTVAEIASVAAPPASDGQSLVLVIDDDPSIGDLIRRFLGREGFVVETALSGAEGLEKAASLRPDAIVLDVLMPRMDGWAVLAQLKADPRLHDIPVVMLTITDDKSIGFALGAADYMTKPIDRERLTSVLRKYQRAAGTSPLLLVEDDLATRQMMRKLLEKEGWLVDEAENGRVALERLAVRVPDLILLDLMMPEMDGFEFVRVLHNNEAWRTVPVVVLTAKDITGEDRARLNGHAERILQKGAYSREELLAEVRKLIVAQTRQTETV